MTLGVTQRRHCFDRDSELAMNGKA